MADISVTHTQAREIVDTLVKTLERNFRGFNISEIIEGGSLGHGTTVFSKYDIDLVIYSRDISGEAIHRAGNYQQWLGKLDTFLDSTFGQDYKKTKMTLRSVQFKFKDTIDVDLLVSPYWTDQHELYRFLKTIPKEKRDDFTVCASKWQVQFFKKQPPQVKELIRKAKEWRNREWPTERRSTEGRPSSYLMSLLVVAAYEKDPRNVTRAIKQLVGSSIDLCWAGHFYEKRDYPNMLPPRPRVVDPANPANNVWLSGFMDCRPGEKPNDYEPGNGKSRILQAKIGTISLD